MQKLFFFFLFISGIAFSQTHGTCKITKTTPDTKTKITFRFVSPSGKPATSHLAFKMNGDNQLIETDLNSTYSIIAGNSFTVNIEMDGADK